MLVQVRHQILMRSRNIKAMMCVFSLMRSYVDSFRKSKWRFKLKLNKLVMSWYLSKHNMSFKIFRNGIWMWKLILSQIVRDMMLRLIRRQLGTSLEVRLVSLEQVMWVNYWAQIKLQERLIKMGIKVGKANLLVARKVQMVRSSVSIRVRQ